MALEQSVNPHLSTPVTVTRLAGTVMVIDQKGAARELHIGDQVQPGEHISVSPNSGVLLLLPDGNMLPVGNMPAVQIFTDSSESSMEDLPVQAPLTAGDGEALIATAESRDNADSSDKKTKHDEKGDGPVSSSIVEETEIAMDLSQITPEFSGHSASPGYRADADYETYGSPAAGNDTQSHTNTGLTSASLQPVFVNFVPVVTGDSSGSAKEDVHLTSTGILHITDRNISDIDTIKLSNGNGACGTLAIDQQGHWAYQLDNTNPIVQALGEGEHLTENFTISVTDSHGAVVDKQITITVDGTNDLPVISGVQAGSVAEGATQETSGLLTQTDKDATDTHTWSVGSSHMAQHGVFTVDQNGQWHYKLDNTDPAVNTLAHGQHITEIISVKVADNHGGETTQQVTVVINGTNAAPVIGGTFSGSITEDKVTTVSDKLTVTDTDAADTHTFGVDNPQGTYGRLAVDPNTGQWTYNLNHAKTDALSASEHRLESFNVSVTDHNGGISTHQILIDVAGSNDKPVITAIASQSIDEGAPPTQGRVLSSDVDHGDTATFTTTAHPAGFVLQKDGSYSIDPSDKSFNHLALGEYEVLHIPVTVTDNHGGLVTQDLLITINGTNDIPVVSSIAQKTVAEGGAVAYGLVGALDPDHGDTITYAQASPQAVAGFVLNKDGSYSIDPANKAYDHLAVGEHATLIIPIVAVDNHGATSTPQNLVVTINGTNDNPVIGSVVAKTVAEGSPTFSGQLTSTDVDSTDTATYSTTSTQAGFALNSNGSYTVDPTDSAFEHLAVGQQLVLTIPVTVTDNNGGTSTTNVEVTITGTNDNPVIGNVAATTVAEGSAAFSGQLTSTDVDSTDTETYSTTSTQAGFTLNQNGSYTIDPTDTVFDHLAVGDHQVLTIPVTVTDNNGGASTTNIEVTITGTNDAPVISSVVTLATGTEDTNVVLTEAELLAHATDVDTNDQGQLSVHNLSADHGNVAVNPDGTFTFTPDANYNGAVHFTYDVQDPHGGSTIATASMNLAAVGDAAVITGQDTGSVTEDKNTYSLVSYAAHLIHTQGQLHITDPDAGEDHFNFKSFIKVAPHPEWTPYTSALGGGLEISPDGGWEYRIDTRKSIIQNLGKGESITDTVSVVSEDGTKHIITVTIHGTNDAPVLSSTVSLSQGQEDSDYTLHASDLLANASDVDHNDAGQLSVQNLRANHGTIRDNADGTYTFIPEKDYNGAVHFTYDVQDAHGGSTQATANMNLAAVADAATFSGEDSGALKEDVNISNLHALSVSGSLNVSDPDAGQNSFQFSQFGERAISDPFSGHLRIDRGGSWGYTVDNNNPALQQLGEGQTRDVIYEVRSFDGTTHQITITVTGTNDAPTVSSAVTLAAGTEDTNVVLTEAELLAHATDVDTNDQRQLSVHNVNADHGNVAVNPDGTFTFTPDKDYNGQVHFTYDVQDPHGASTQATAIMDLAAVGDAAVIGGVDTGSVTEATAGADMSPDYAQPGMSTLGNSPLYADGKLTITDPDAGEAAFDTKGVGYNYHGQYGYLLLQENGAWHYFADAGNTAGVGGGATQHGTAIDQLGEGQSLTDTITVYAKDGTTHDIVITIHGSNDRPYCSSEVVLQSGTEDTSQTLTTAQLLANTVDVDANDAGKLSIANLRADHGSIRDNGDGTFTFTPARDYNGAVHFNFDVQDGHGGVTHTGATTSLAAVGDAATFSGDDSSGVIEDKDPTRGVSDPKLTATGHLNVIDADARESNFGSRGSHSSAADQFGGNLRIDQHGTWYYSVSNSAVQHLSEGQQVQVTHTIHSADGTPHDIVITITGTNDAPVISSPVALASGAEDTDVTIHASDLLAHASDVDTQDVGHLSVHNLQSNHGTITDNHDGTFTLHPAKDYNGKVDFTYDVQDPQGASSSTSASLQLATVGDAAVITAVGKTLKEDVDADGHHSLNATGHFKVVDPDGSVESKFATDASGVDIMHTGSLGGSLQLYADGGYFYSLSNYVVDHLKEGEVLKDQFTISSADGTTQQVEFTIRGTNDAPFIDGGSLHTATFEDGAVLQGQFTGIDPDHGDQQNLAYSTSASVAGFTLNKDGSYTFDPSDAAYQHGSLSSGIDEHVIIPITVTDSDGLHSTQNLRISIIPTNDAPVVSSAVTLTSGSEDHSVVIHQSDLLAHASDVDDYDQLSVTSLHADHGTLVDNHNHTYTFTPDANYNGQVSFSYQVQDNHGASTPARATMNLAAVADASVIAGQDSANATEDTNIQSGKLEASGQLTIVDPDAGEDHFIAQTRSTGTGTFDLKSDGSWTYSADNSQHAIQSLAAGETFVDSFLAVSPDGGQHRVEVTVTGTNDVPTISAAVALPSGTEDTDVTIHANDLLANATDADDNDRLSVHNLQSNHGTITDNHDGTYTFSPAKDYNGKVDFTYDVQDGHGGSTAAHATINLAAGADAAVISGEDTTSATEDLTYGRSMISSNLNQLQISDPDAGENIFRVTGAASAGSDPNEKGNWVNGDHGIGQFILHANGEWVFRAFNNQNAIQSLGNGEQATDTLTIYARDGTSHVLTVNITGTNDAPTVTADAVLATGSEDTATTIDPADLLAHATDIDDGDTATLSIANLQADHGTLTTNPDGTYVFTPEKDYNGKVTFTYDVQDAHGSSVQTHATMDLAAVDDPSTFTGKDQDTLKEDQPMWGHLLETNQNQLDLTDPDTGKVLLIPTGASSVASSTDTGGWVSGSLGVGQFIMHADGRWLYKADNNDPRVQALGDGKPLVETLQVQGQDGSVHTLTATIHGSNDAPTVSSSVTLNAGTEDTAVTLTSAQLLAHASDVDTGDTAQLSVHNLSSDHGQITDNHDGTFTFTPDPNYNGPVSFTYDVQDPQGASVATSATIDLASIADTPILSVDITDTADNVLNASEVTSASITGKLDPGVASTLDSIDISDGTASSSIDASRVSVAADGSYSVSGLDLSAFKDGLLTITAHATSHDGTTATSTDTIVKDTSAHASIVLDPITGDNIINTAESQQQNIAVTGSVTGDYKDGDMVTVSVGSQQYQAAVDGQGHFSVDVPESEFEVAASSGTGVRAEITVTDDAGNTNTVSAISPVVFNLIPQPATLTGESGVHSTVYHATLTVQGAAGHWGIQDHTGHSTTTMAGHYGMLSVNAQTGELTYDARTYSGVQKSGTPDTGTHTEHFVITLGGQQNAQVEVLVELSGQSTHGHSGHFVQKVEVLDMNSAPVSQHDEPDQDTDQMDSVTLFADADDHDGSSSSDDPQGDQPSSADYHDEATQGADAEDDDMLSLVRTEENPLDFDGLAAHLSATPAERVSGQQDSMPLDTGDVLDSTQAGEADILHAVDKLDSSEPDAVDKPDKMDKADSEDTLDHGAETPVDDAPDVMPDRSAMDSQLVEPPDEHQT